LAYDLEERLQQEGHKVFLDARSIKVADVWRPIVYRRLADCDGAVLLLSQAALTADWVRTEASVLAWRRELAAGSPHAVLVAVVLTDGVTRKNVKRSFPSLALEDGQFVTARLDRPKAEDEVIGAITERFRGLRHGPEDPMQSWVSSVDGWLEGVHKTWRLRMAQAVDVPDEDWQESGRRETLANAILHTELTKAYRALDHVIDSGAPNRHDIVEYVVPVGIPSDAAMCVLQALARPEGDRVLVVNVSFHETAQLFVRRATCCSTGYVLVPPVPPQGTSAEAVLREIRKSIGRAVGARDPDSFGHAELERTRHQVVVFLQRGVGGLTTRLLEATLSSLRAELGRCLFVVVAGREDLPPARAAPLSEVMPEGQRLSQEYEDDIDQQVRLLRQLASSRMAS
jgi:hypothetical protein